MSLQHGLHRYDAQAAASDQQFSSGIGSHLSAPIALQVQPDFSSHSFSDPQHTTGHSQQDFPPRSTNIDNRKSQLSVTKSYKPYYCPQELTQLIKLQAYARGDGPRHELGEARVENWRQLACGFIERVGARLGFPRRTIATAQGLYHRFHLHFPLKDFSYHDVSLSAILVASKLQDTLKSLRDIQMVGWQVRSILEGGPGIGEGDTLAQDAARPQLIAIERLILQTLCFNFSPSRAALPNSLNDSLTVASNTKGSHYVNISNDLSEEDHETPLTRLDVFKWNIRLSKSLGASRHLTFLSHLLAIDVHRILASLSYPPHTLALACIFLATFLLPGHPNCTKWAGGQTIPEDANAWASTPFSDGWTTRFYAKEEDVQEVSHSILNLFISLCPSPSSSSAHGSRTSPSSPFSTNTSPIDPSNDPSVSPSGNLLASGLNGSMMPSAVTSIRDSSLSSRERHLMQTGIPHTLTGCVAIAAKSVEDFTKVKICLRQRAKQLSDNRSPSAAEHNGTFGADLGEEQAARWIGGLSGYRTARKQCEQFYGIVDFSTEYEPTVAKSGDNVNENSEDISLASALGVGDGHKNKPMAISVRYRF